MTSELLTALGTVAESSESLAAVESLRQTVVSGEVGRDILRQVEGC